MEEAHLDLILRVPCLIGGYSGVQSDEVTQHLSSIFGLMGALGRRGAWSLVSVTSSLIGEI